MRRHSSIVRRPGRTCKQVRSPNPLPAIADEVKGSHAIAHAATWGKRVRLRDVGALKGMQHNMLLEIPTFFEGVSISELSKAYFGTTGTLAQRLWVWWWACANHRGRSLTHGAFLLEDAVVKNVYVGVCLACSLDARVPYACDRDTRLACKGASTHV